MFASCTHGFISATCPHCKGGDVADMGDEPGGPVVDMGRIIDSAVDRLELTGLRENRREARQIERTLR